MAKKAKKVFRQDSSDMHVRRSKWRGDNVLEGSKAKVSANRIGIALTKLKGDIALAKAKARNNKSR